MLNSEREKIVVDLYKNQNKSIREIAQEARMSFRDIGAILKKAEEANNGNAIDDGKDNNNNKHTKATQAYKLFSEGKKPVSACHIRSFLSWK
jgi:transposase